MAITNAIKDDSCISRAIGVTRKLITSFSQLNQNEGTPFQSRVEFQAGYSQLVHSTRANVAVMILQGCKSTPQKSRPIESGHGRHAVQVTNVCSYKLG